MKSPIKHIMEHVHNSIINIAPERAEEFINKFPNLTIQYLDTDEWICNSNSKTCHINISRSVAETAWCLSYCYMVFYQKYYDGKMILEKRKIYYKDDEEAFRAAQLYKWAFDNWLYQNLRRPWDLNFPYPKNPPQSFFEKVATELSLCALAYMLHHELAHIILRHEKSNDNYVNIEAEKEADIYAANWILDNNLKTDGPVFRKRALGIAVALEMLIAKGIYKKDINHLIDHPRAFDRLINTLSNFITNPNHAVWAVLVSTLSIHLNNAGISLPEKLYETFYDCLDDYLNLLSHLDNNSHYQT